MHFYDSLSNSLPITGEGRALAIGTFDGVHRGHEALVSRLKQAAADRGLVSAVLTFTDLPYRFFNPDATARLLTLPDEKRAAFETLGLEELWLVPFSADIARQSAEQFAMDILCARLHVRLLVCGPDFALGAGRGGDVNALRTIGAHLGFEVLVLDEKIADGGAPISSTRIREAIERGEVEDGARLLGREFSFTGTVVPGQQLGRTIGFPTINVQPPLLKVTPAHGVYAVRASWSQDGAVISHPAALNIGVRPTVDGTRQQIEFHVIDASIASPPAGVQIEFVSRLREEIKFDGLDGLRDQLQRDVVHARALLLP